MDDIKETFIIECNELLNDMEEGLLHIDQNGSDIEALNSIFRGAHSIKGGSGALGFMPVYEFTHIMEELLDDMREGSIIPSSESIDVLLESLDILKSMIEMIQNEEEVPEDLAKDVTAKLLKIRGSDSEGQGENEEEEFDESQFGFGEDVAAGIETKYIIKFSPNESLFDTGNEPLLVLKSLKDSGECKIETDISTIPEINDIEVGKSYFSWNIELISSISKEEVEEIFEFVLDHAIIEIEAEALSDNGEQETLDSLEEADVGIFEAPEETKISTIKQNQTKEKAEKPKKTAKNTNNQQQSQSIRVDVHKVDRMVNMIGEIVITQSMLSVQMKELDLENSSRFSQGLDLLSRHTRELQEAVMSVRMQPIKSIFSRMPRLVRDLSKKLDKKIELITSGEETEVDKTVVERLSDPLTHMIRNSMDHGIESPKVRAENGKDETGKIYLKASHSSGKIVIEISDDGAGINRERVLNKAIEKGLVSADVKLADEEIDALVFHPGFSTAEEVSEVSGRGVGMDVVNKNIKELGGTILVKSTPGEGSRFTLMLPLTLAILDGMIVSCGKEDYVIPINSIIETLQTSRDKVKQIAGGNDLINLRFTEA